MDGTALIFWYTKKKFWYTKKKLGGPKKSEPDQKFPETEQIFFWSTKKREKQTGQLVDQETDQNHMDGTKVPIDAKYSFSLNNQWHFLK